MHRRRAMLKLGCLILLIVIGNIAAVWLANALNLKIRPSTEDLVHQMIMVSALAYTLLIAIPFVPGVEIGLSLIGLLGPAIVFLVYVCTVVGLLMGFLAGRLIPLRSLIALLDEFHLDKASQLLAAIEPMNMEERLRFLLAKAPHRYLPLLLRHRYVALAVVINLPGNIVIGGGGGIALMAGASRLYSLPGFLVTVLLAVSPLPLAIGVFGKTILTG